MLKQRQLDIKQKGFNMVEENSPHEAVDFSKMKVGLRKVDDALINVSSFGQVKRDYGDKQFILNAIYKQDYNSLREASKYFYRSSGIYYRLCRYLAFLYRYDWYVSTIMIDENQAGQTKALKDFSRLLTYFEHSNIKKLFGDIALEIVVNGSYYGCVVDFGEKFAIQQLPSKYCRCRYFSGTNPVVEFNMQFFDAAFPNAQQRLIALKAFPQEIQRGYILYKQGKLVGDYPGDGRGWIALDPQASIRFSLNNSEFPPFVGVIPSIIDLDEAQELDRKKTMQQLLKIIVQKLPLDKNGDLIFDVDEAKDIHNNAVAMLKRAVGIDVLTTFADIEKIDTRDNNSTTTKDDLEKVERSLFNSAGVSQNIFNADGNLAVTNSILNDEASFRDLILQFESFLNRIAEKFSRKNHYTFLVTMLETTQYNYKEMSKAYEGQTKIGFSKMLPQIALGHSQLQILADAHFENEVLHLSEVMLPPLSSNTISGQDLLGRNNQSNTSNSQKQQTSEKESGRPEKQANEQSDKTIANKESMS